MRLSNCGARSTAPASWRMTDETPLLCIDDEAECAALAAALGNDAALEIVLTELEPDDFWRKANQLRHAAMWKLAAADKPVDQRLF